MGSRPPRWGHDPTHGDPSTSVGVGRLWPDWSVSLGGSQWGRDPTWGVATPHMETRVPRWVWVVFGLIGPSV